MIPEVFALLRMKPTTCTDLINKWITLICQSRRKINSSPRFWLPWRPVIMPAVRQAHCAAIGVSGGRPQTCVPSPPPSGGSRKLSCAAASLHDPRRPPYWLQFHSSIDWCWAGAQSGQCFGGRPGPWSLCPADLPLVARWPRPSTHPGGPPFVQVWDPVGLYCLCEPAVKAHPISSSLDPVQSMVSRPGVGIAAPTSPPWLESLM